ncbi:MAG: hypothetical protein OEM42_02780 [Deltaproteobacteria bacterium]|nr:hypothetical protein [Deltaproteobacteria bacterium]
MKPEGGGGSARPKPAGRGLRLAAKIALFLAALLFLNYVIGWLANFIAFQMWPRHVDAASFLLFATVVSYMLLVCLAITPGPMIFLLRGAMP